MVFIKIRFKVFFHPNIKCRFGSMCCAPYHFHDFAIFYDEFAIQFFDDEHSFDEERFLLLGMSSGVRFLIVCHCEREAGDVIRIISARKATRRESAFYKGE